MVVERFGQQYIGRNRAGAASNLATETVVVHLLTANTLLMINAANTSNTTLFDKLSFNFVQDIVPVASMARGPGVIAVTPMFPVKSVPELIAYPKPIPARQTRRTHWHASACQRRTVQDNGGR